MKIKKKLKYVLLIAFIALLIPYSTEGIPEWKIVVLDKEGKRVESIEVVEEWHFSRIHPMRLERKTTDKNGEVVFPARIYTNPFLFRVFFSLFDYLDFITSHFNPLCPCGNVSAGKQYRSCLLYTSPSPRD